MFYNRFMQLVLQKHRIKVSYLVWGQKILFTKIYIFSPSSYDKKSINTAKK